MQAYTALCLFFICEEQDMTFKPLFDSLKQMVHEATQVLKLF